MPEYKGKKFDYTTKGVKKFKEAVAASKAPKAAKKPKKSKKR